MTLGRLGREEGIAGDQLEDCSHNGADLAEVEESGRIDYIEVVVVGDSYCIEAVGAGIAEGIGEGIGSCSRKVLHCVVYWHHQLH